MHHIPIINITLYIAAEITAKTCTTWWE